MAGRAGTLVALSLVAALLEPATIAKAGKADDTLNIAWNHGLESLDYNFSTAREMVVLATLIYDTLVDRDPDTLQYRPLLAKSWKYIDDTTVEFELRDDVKFHDGTPLTAEDAVFTLNWISRPENGVIRQENVQWIAGADQVDTYRFRLRLKSPFPPLMEYLSGPVVIYPKAYYTAAGPKGMGVKPVGTGPYRVTDVVPGNRVTLERNPVYFKNGPKGTPAIGKIVVRNVPELNTQIVELISGRADWIWNVPTDQAERLASRQEVKIVNAKTMRVGFIQMDAAGRGKPTPLTNKLVRQAIAHAIDRESIVKNLVRGASEVVHGFCYPTQFGCTQDVAHYDYDPAKAKKLLAEAGYPNGFQIDLYAFGDKRYLEAFMSYLSAVGIKANLSMLAYGPLRDKTDAGDIPMSYVSWGSYSIADVFAIIPRFFTFGPADYARDKQISDWVLQAEHETDRDKRLALFHNAVKRIAEQAYMLPTFTYNTNYAISSTLDFKAPPDEIPRLYAAKWK